MDDRAALRALIDRLSDAGAALARTYLEELVAAEAVTDRPEAIYHTLELTDPLGTAVVAAVRLGPFATTAAAWQAADAIAAEVAARYLESGADWERCIQQVLAERYAHLLAPTPPDQPVSP
jgi:hypothetical protein